MQADHPRMVRTRATGSPMGASLTDACPTPTAQGPPARLQVLTVATQAAPGHRRHGQECRARAVLGRVAGSARRGKVVDVRPLVAPGGFQVRTVGARFQEALVDRRAAMDGRPQEPEGQRRARARAAEGRRAPDARRLEAVEVDRRRAGGRGPGATGLVPLVDHGQRVVARGRRLAAGPTREAVRRMAPADLPGQRLSARIDHPPVADRVPGPLPRGSADSPRVRAWTPNRWRPRFPRVFSRRISTVPRAVACAP